MPGPTTPSPTPALGASCRWPLDRWRAALDGSTSQDQILTGLRGLGSPCHAELDTQGLSWVVVSPPKLELYKRLSALLDPTEFAPVFELALFSQALLALAFELLLGPSSRSRALHRLDPQRRELVARFARSERVPIDEGSLRELSVTLSTGFIFGLDLTPALGRTESTSLLAYVLASSSRSARAFVERDRFAQLLDGLGNQVSRADRDPDAATPEQASSFVSELALLLSSDSRGATPRPQGRLILRDDQSGEETFRSSALAALIMRLEERRNTPMPGALTNLAQSSTDDTQDSFFATEAPSPRRRLSTPSPSRIGPYVVLQRVGRGASGDVYLCRDPSDRKVAIKVLHKAPGAKSQDLARIGREVEIALELKHPNITDSFDYDVDSQGCYLVMEYLAGGSLGQRLRRKQQLGELTTLRLLRQVASGLEHAFNHPKRYIHRDLKPENILFDAQGHAHLSDFGMAVGQSKDATRFTASGEVFGTFPYMAPEQMWDTKSADTRSDLWSLGIIAFRCLSGGLPFPAVSVKELFQQVQADAPLDASDRLAHVSLASQALVNKLLQKPPQQRFQSATELLAALEGVHPLWQTAAQSPPARLSLVFPNGHRLFLFHGDRLDFGRDSGPKKLCLRPLPTELFRAETTLISGHHGQLEHRDERFMVSDHSSNGTSLNGSPLSRGERAPLADGDQLKLASSLQLDIHIGPQAVLLTRPQNWRWHAYLWVAEHADLNSLTRTLSDWPSCPLDIVTDGQRLGIVAQQPTLYNGSPLGPLEARDLEAGAILQGEWGELRVEVVDDEMFKRPTRPAQP